MRDIPAEVVIIGGGVIGLEFADAYANFGSTVHVVELTPSVLPGNDKRVQREAQKALEALGVVFHLGVAVDSVAQAGERVIATLTDGSVLEADVVLSRARAPPERAGLRLPRGGHRDGPRRRQGRRVLPHERRRRLRDRRPHRRDDARARRRGRGRGRGAQRRRGAQGRSADRRPSTSRSCRLRSTPSRASASWARLATAPRSAASTASRSS